MYMKIFEELKEDHKTLRKLSDELLETKGASDKRKEAFQELKTVLKTHAKSEERNFYIPMLEHDKSQEHARHSISEHHDIDEKIEELEEKDMDSSEWMEAAKELKELVEHHLDEEEEDIFEVAAEVLTEEQQENLGRHYRTMMKEEME